MWISYLVKYKNHEMGTLNRAHIDISVVNEDKASDVIHKLQEEINDNRKKENPNVEWGESTNIIIEEVYPLKRSA